MKEGIDIIQIGWKKMEYSEENLKKLDGGTNHGIYQIYGYHPVYGENTLLYIGKSNLQNFATRLKERHELNATVLRPKWLHIGQIYKTEDTKNADWDELVDISEQILIKAHSPAYNSMEIKGLYPSDKFDKN